MNENQIIQKMDRNVNTWANRFPAQMEALEKSPISRVRSLTSFDYCTLGEMLGQFENYAEWVKESGTVADLGKLPTVALDIITAAYGASIIPLVCSVQPIEEQRGTIYFKQVKAVTTRGNVTADQILRNPLAQPDVMAEGYAGEKISTTATISGTALANTVTPSPAVVVRPNSFKITSITRSGVAVGTPAIVGMDDGNGNILGIGLSGTITYSTGAFTINLAAAPVNGDVINYTFGTDFEAGSTYAKINPSLGTASIDAEIFVLGSELGMFKAFSMQKRFGKMAEDEMITDLTNEITAEIGHTAISRLIANTAGGTNWSKTHVGYSWQEHKQQLKDKISEVEGLILQASGRGVVNYLIAGSNACAILSNLPGFTKSAMTGSGPQLYGTLDGVTVIRTPASALTNRIYCTYKGNGYFDAPIVYSPYMPLFVSNTLPLPGNVLVKQGIAAVWAGLQVVVPTFTGYVDITA